MAKRILCVIRTSTLQQEIESQKEDMLAFLLSKGFKDDEIEWLVSKGASARTANKVYLQMLEQIKSICLTSPTIKTCAVWHLNRLGRIGKYLDEMKNWFIDNHIQLYVKTPEITLLNKDGSYNMGNTIVFGVLSTTIPSETEETMGKLERGKNYLRDQGLWVGEKLNFGFTHTKDRHIVVDAEKMAIVQLVYSEYATGKYSQHSLYKELESRGIKLSEKQIQRMLSIDCYKPYIDAAIIEKVNEVKEGNTSKTKESKHTHLALKIFRCECGAAYIGSCDRYRCLKVSSKRYTRDTKYEHPSIDSDVIDFLLWDIAKHIHRGYITTQNTESIDDLKKQQMVINQKLQYQIDDRVKQASKIDKAKELYLDGDYTKSQYQHKKADIEAVIVSIDRNIEYFKSQLSLLDSQIEALSNPSYLKQFMMLASVGNIEDAEKQREIIRMHIKYVTVKTTTFHNHRAAIITIENKYGNTYRFLYDSKNNRSIDFREKLYIINDDNSIAPFGTYDVDKYYRESYQIALNVEKNEGRSITQFLIEHMVNN